jgi:hypothetical protein
MIATDDLAKEEEKLPGPTFVEIAKGILKCESGAILDDASYHTKYNIIRFLERIHDSSPKPYYEHALHRGWYDYPPSQCFGAYAARGFRLNPRAIHSRPMIVLRSKVNDCQHRLQREISLCLLEILDSRIPDGSPGGDRENYFYCLVNASYALIRWLHCDQLDELLRVMVSKESHEEFDPRIKGNLFLALWRLGNPGVFEQFGHIFDGMKLRWVPPEVGALAKRLRYSDVDLKERPDDGRAMSLH